MWTLHDDEKRGEDLDVDIEEERTRFYDKAKQSWYSLVFESNSQPNLKMMMKVPSLSFILVIAFLSFNLDLHIFRSFPVSRDFLIISRETSI